MWYYTPVDENVKWHVYNHLVKTMKPIKHDNKSVYFEILPKFKTKAKDVKKLQGKEVPQLWFSHQEQFSFFLSC